MKSSFPEETVSGGLASGSFCAKLLCAIFALAVVAGTVSALVVEDFNSPWSGTGQLMLDPEDMSNGVLALAPGEYVDIPLPGNIGVVKMDIYDFGENAPHPTNAFGPRWAIEGEDSSTNAAISIGAGIMYRTYLNGGEGYSFCDETSRTGSWFSPGFFGGPRQCSLETWNGALDLNNGSGKWTTWIFEVSADGTATVSAQLGANYTTQSTLQGGGAIPMENMNKVWISGGRSDLPVGPVASGLYARKSVLVDNIEFVGSGVPNLMPGDANGDDVVNIYDFLILRSNYGKSPATWYEGDFNTDNKVDIYDFLLLRANYGRGGFDAEPSYVDNFDPGWDPAQNDWRIATWTQNGTAMSPDRCREDGQGHLVQTVLAGEPYRGGSMQSSAEYPYGRWVARLKPSPVSGVLNSMFTMDWDDLTTGTPNDGKRMEVDIEFLTYTFGTNRGRVHLALHCNGISNVFVEDVYLSFNPSDEYHDWGFDILPDKIVWHVDGQPLRTYNRQSHITFNENYEMFFNSWTDTSWIHGPASQDADYYIDWVKFYPYNQ